MGKRLTNRQRLAFKIETLTDSEVTEVLEYISIMESMRRRSNVSELFEDDLINFLAEATENQRARQVFEWDKVRRRAEIHGAFNVSSKN
jgi:hypothetical protein